MADGRTQILSKILGCPQIFMPNSYLTDSGSEDYATVTEGREVAMKAQLAWRPGGCDRDRLLDLQIKSSQSFSRTKGPSTYDIQFFQGFFDLPTYPCPILSK